MSTGRRSFLKRALGMCVGGLAVERLIAGSAPKPAAPSLPPSPRFNVIATSLSFATGSPDPDSYTLALSWNPNAKTWEEAATWTQ